MDGIFLPPQLIYQGESPKCLPEIRFPEDWDITYTLNHWSNEEITIQYIHNIIILYLLFASREFTCRSADTMYL